jgi:DNA-binding response OmpR family regulator
MEDIKVLLVDDEEEFASALAERLNLRGIRTLTAFGGEEALQMMETDTPRVVLLDIMMPGLGGKEIFDRIRLKHPDISVIFLSGQDAPEVGPEYGNCLIKPVRIDELIRKIRSVSEKT